VAIKVLPRDKSTPEAIANFTREIRAFGQPRSSEAGGRARCRAGRKRPLSGHPNTCRATDLRKLVRQGGPLGISAAASIISQVAEGLEYAHARESSTATWSPGNVLVSPDGEAKLSDLGFAGSLEGSSESDPRHGKIVGTADFLSPDQIHDPWNPAPAWDIYSLGCTLYYAATGKVPFPGGTTAEKARGALRVAAVGSAAAELPAQRRVCRGHGRHDGERAVAANRHGARGSGETGALRDGRSCRRRCDSRRGDVPATASPGDTGAAAHRGAASGRRAGFVAGDAHAGRGRLTAVYWPLAVFVLTPLVLAGAVLLLWWLARMLF